MPRKGVGGRGGHWKVFPVTTVKAVAYYNYLAGLVLKAVIHKLLMTLLRRKISLP